jgi:hypothetical protein
MSLIFMLIAITFSPKMRVDPFAIYGCGALRCRMRALLASYNAAPHNRYQPHPAESEQHTKCSNRAFVLLKMGIMMPETC